MFLNKAGINLAELRKYLNGKIDVALIPATASIRDFGSNAFPFKDLYLAGAAYIGAIQLNATQQREIFSTHTNILHNATQQFFSMKAAQSSVNTIFAEFAVYNNNVQTAYFGYGLRYLILNADSAGSDQSVNYQLSNNGYNINNTILSLAAFNLVMSRTGPGGTFSFSINPVSGGANGPTNFSVMAKFRAMGPEASTIIAV